MNEQTKLDDENPRKAEYDIDPIFLNRWSPRSFLADKPIHEKDLYALFEAARWAPSSNNEQPWRFIVARTPEQRAVFHSFINESNRIWCEKAPVLVLVISKNTTSGGKPYRTHAFDTGTAWGFLALQAVSNGVVTHPMGGFNRDLARQTLNIPDDFDVHIVVAIGYRGELEQLNEVDRLREKPNGRRPLSETIMDGTFQE